MPVADAAFRQVNYVTSGTCIKTESASDVRDTVCFVQAGKDV